MRPGEIRYSLEDVPPLTRAEEATRPRTRGDCKDGPRPCPWVSCKYHLYLDVSDAGAIKLNFPRLAVEELACSCALDVADEGGATLEEIGEMFNLTRERVRQIEVRGLVRLHVVARKRGL